MANVTPRNNNRGRRKKSLRLDGEGWQLFSAYVTHAISVLSEALSNKDGYNKITVAYIDPNARLRHLVAKAEDSSEFKDLVLAGEPSYVNVFSDDLNSMLKHFMVSGSQSRVY